MKTINQKLSEKLDPYLTDVDTEYIITDYWTIYASYEVSIVNTEDKNCAMYWKGKPYWRFTEDVHPICVSANKHYEEIFKTLTLEEAIEFVPYQLQYNQDTWTFTLEKRNWRYEAWYSELLDWKTPLEAIEKMLTYLLDNNLLPKPN